MKFANPEYLYLLLLLPLLFALYKYADYRRKKSISTYGEPELVKRLIPSYASMRSRIIFWASMLAMALIIIAVARPRYGKGKTTIVTKGVEMVVALDISNSMLADDIYPNRLERAKKLVSRIAGELKGNKIAIVVFAGDSYVQLPITDDFISVEMFLDGITPGLITRQGTDIAGAIDMASRCFTPNDKIGKAIVLITDGENHEGNAEEAARKASEEGKKVYILGIGTAKGGRIPVGDDKFLRDREGQVVVSKLNEEMARSIAQAGNGMYLHVDNSNNAQKILSEQLGNMMQNETKTDIYTNYEELFIYAALLALLFLCLDLAVNAATDIMKRKEKKTGK